MLFEEHFNAAGKRQSLDDYDCGKNELVGRNFVR